MAEEGETPCLNSRRYGVVARLSVSHRHSTHNGTIWFAAAFADTMFMYTSLITIFIDLVLTDDAIQFEKKLFVTSAS